MLSVLIETSFMDLGYEFYVLQINPIFLAFCLVQFFFLLFICSWLSVIYFVWTEMKVVAAYLLAVLGGKTSPSAADLKDILGSGNFYFENPFFLLTYDTKLHYY